MKKWKMGVILACFIAIVVLSLATEISPIRIYPASQTEQTQSTDYYSSKRNENAPIGTLSIPNDIVLNNVLPLFINLRSGFSQTLKDVYPDLTIPQSRVKFLAGHHFSININGDTTSISKTFEPVLDSLENYYHIYVNDSHSQDLDFKFYEHPNMGEKGIRTYIPLDDLPDGQHELTVKTLTTAKKDTTDNGNVVYKKRLEARVPFWKETE